MKLPVYEVRLRKVKTLTIKDVEPHELKLNNEEKVANLLFKYLKGVDREHFVVLMINARNVVIGIHTAHIGELTASIVHPREVFKPAILTNSAAIIVAHNHPSGDPTPTKDDIRITERLVEAGKFLGIDVLDHVIIGEPPKFYSMRDKGVVDFS